MKPRFLAVALLSGLAAATAPLFGSNVPPVTVTTFATLAPNFFGSPSFADWAANGFSAMEQGLTTFGSAGPTQFNVLTNPVPVIDGIVTGYPSWMGVADPTGADANEYGARPSFVGVINGNGGLISISNMGFYADSSDAGDALSLDYPNDSVLPGDWTYDTYDIGIIDNPGGGYTFVTSGDPTQLVNEIISIGVGNGYASYDGPYDPVNGNDDPNPGATDQQILNYDAGNIPAYDFTGNFTYTGAPTGSATFVFTAAVPETMNTGLLLGLTLAGLAGGAAQVRRRATR